MSRYLTRQTVALAAGLAAAVLQLADTPPQDGSAWRSLYASYAFDVILPFAFYLLLCAAENRSVFLRHWWIKAGLVFAAGATAETFQAFGFAFLGSTFDPFDLLAYAIGVLLAAGLDRLILARFSFWQTPVRV